MKKTMLALMATVGLAFCAKAEVLNSTGFEDYGENGFAVPGDDNGATVGNQYWQPGIADTTDFESTILKEYENDGEKPGTLPKNFESAGSKYLSVDTGSNVLLRKAASDPTSSCDLNSDPVFLDTNVKFTATEDNTVTPEAGDKLIVWLYADEGGTTNLMITAAEALNMVGAPTAPTNFVANVTVSPDTWYRLTVKAAIDGNSHTYFNVYLDGAPVAEVGGQKDFYSLVDSAAGGGQEITAVGFKGTGALDNVVWTTEDLFPVVPPTTVALTVSATGADYSSLVYIVGESTTTNEVDGAAASIEAAVNDVVTFVLTVADGYTPTVTGYELQKGEEQVDEFSDVYYPYTFTETVTQAMIDDGLTLTINVTEDEPPTPPTPEDEKEIAPGGKGSIADETGETYTKGEVEAMVTVVAPNAESLSEKAKADFDNYFTKDASYNSITKKWEVTVTLDADTLEADVEEAVEDALDDIVSDAETKTVDIPAGFYYKIEFGTTVDLTGTPLKGLSAGPVTMPALGENAGFFKVSVDTTSFGE